MHAKPQPTQYLRADKITCGRHQGPPTPRLPQSACVTSTPCLKRCQPSKPTSQQSLALALRVGRHGAATLIATGCLAALPVAMLPLGMLRLPRLLTPQHAPITLPPMMGSIRRSVAKASMSEFTMHPACLWSLDATLVLAGLHLSKARQLQLESLNAR